MKDPARARPRRRPQPLRMAAIGLMRLGVPAEVIAISGMVLGILAGASFMGTSEAQQADLFWALALLFCLLRIACIRIDSFSHPFHLLESEDEYFKELPERVSDAVTLIGFGFASESNPWLGLAAALAAIFSAYVRSFGVQRGAAKRRASGGPMTRTHRLVLLSVVAVFMIVDLPRGHFTTPLPQIALWVVFFGCLATVAFRWYRIGNAGTPEGD